LGGLAQGEVEKLRGAELENRYLRELLRLARIEKYGPGSKKLSDEQLALLELEPGVSQAEVEAESERAQLKLPFRKAAQAAKHPGRQELPAHLPRVEKIIACTPRAVRLFPMRKRQGSDWLRNQRAA
jgi:transposase